MITYEMVHQAPHNGFELYVADSLNDYLNNKIKPLVYNDDYKLKFAYNNIFIIDFKKIIYLDSFNIATGFPQWSWTCQAVGMIIYDSNNNKIIDTDKDLLNPTTFKVNKCLNKLVLYFKRNYTSNDYSYFIRQLTLTYNNILYIYKKENDYKSIINNNEVIINNLNDVSKYYCDLPMIDVLNKENKVNFILNKN